MFGPMHKIAAMSGEGLRPQFLKLLDPTASNVIEFQPTGFVRSGPNPVRALPDVLPSNVVLFSFGNRSSDVSATGRRGLVPRIGRAKRLTGRNT